MFKRWLVSLINEWIRRNVIKRNVIETGNHHVVLSDHSVTSVHYRRVKVCWLRVLRLCVSHALTGFVHFYPYSLVTFRESDCSVFQLAEMT
jgi:hypothetical protein